MASIRIIEAAKDKIRTADAWTQECRAENQLGQIVDPSDETATAWDLFGAFEAVGAGVYSQEAQMVAQKAEKLYGYRDLLRFDDRVTHVNIIGAFNAVIVDLERSAHLA